MRSAVVGLLVLLVVAAGVPGGVVGTQDDPVLAVTDVSATPRPAVPGEEVTVSVDVTNQAAGSAVAEIDAIALRSAPGDPLEEYDRVRGFGRLAPGTTVTADLSVSFDSEGTRRLQAIVYARDQNGDRITIEAPVTVTVEDDHPTIDVAVESTVAGTESTATVTLANALSRELRDVSVSLDGVETVQDRRISSRVGAGETVVYQFTVEPADPGTRVVTATVAYETSTGVERSTTSVTRFVVDPLRERMTLDAVAVDGAIQATVTNLGNTDAESVIVRGSVVEGEGVSVGRATVPTIDPGSSETVTLPVSGVDPDESAVVSVTGQYEVDGRPDVVSTLDEARVTFEQERTPTPDVPAEITLSGVEVSEEDDGRLRITGSASNVGLTQANSVIVSVAAAEGVTPAEPRTYFVGTVPASDFVSFDVFARVDDDVRQVPLEVTYLSEGNRRTATFTVEVNPSVQNTETPQQRGGGLLVPVLVGGVVVVAVLVIVAIGWRSRRADR